MSHRNNKLVWTVGINGHILDTEHKGCLCCGYQQKLVSPNVSFVHSATTKIHG